MFVQIVATVPDLPASAADGAVLVVLNDGGVSALYQWDSVGGAWAKIASAASVIPVISPATNRNIPAMTAAGILVDDNDVKRLQLDTDKFLEIQNAAGNDGLFLGRTDLGSSNIYPIVLLEAHSSDDGTMLRLSSIAVDSQQATIQLDSKGAAGLSRYEIQANSVQAGVLEWLGSAATTVKLSSKSTFNLELACTAAATKGLLINPGNGSIYLQNSSVDRMLIQLASALGGTETIKTVDQTGSDNSNELLLSSGATVNGNSGKATLQSGEPSGAGTRGNVELKGKAITAYLAGVGDQFLINSGSNGLFNIYEMTSVGALATLAGNSVNKYALFVLNGYDASSLASYKISAGGSDMMELRYVGSAVQLMTSPAMPLQLVTDDNGSGDSGDLQAVTGTATGTRGSVKLDGYNVELTVDDFFKIFDGSDEIVNLKLFTAFNQIIMNILATAAAKGAILNLKAYDFSGDALFKFQSGSTQRGETGFTNTLKAHLKSADLTSGSTDKCGVYSGNATAGDSGNIEVVPGTASGTRGIVLLGNHVTIGQGEAGVDYTLTFDGEDSDGVLTYKEDEEEFDFAQDVIAPNLCGDGDVVELTSADSPYSVTGAERSIVCDCSSGAITVNLLAASSAPNRVIEIFKIDAAANNVTIARNGTDTINGATSQTLSSQWSGMQLEKYSAGWLIA